MVIVQEMARPAPVPVYKQDDPTCATALCQVTFTRTNPSNFEAGVPVYSVRS